MEFFSNLNIVLPLVNFIFIGGVFYGGYRALVTRVANLEKKLDNGLASKVNEIAITVARIEGHCEANMCRTHNGN